MNKVGFHYRMDTDHYSEKDLGMWLPRLKQLDASWIVLNAPTSRAIPEGFIARLKNENIEPVLHCDFLPYYVDVTFGGGFSARSVRYSLYNDQ